MAEKEYTELEIELYEKIAKINSINTVTMEGVIKNLRGIVYSKEDKLLDVLVGDFFKISEIVKKTKIPKKFLVLNALEDKND